MFKSFTSTLFFIYIFTLDIPHLSPANYDKIPIMTDAFLKYGLTPEVLKQVWASRLAPEGTLCFVEHQGMGSNKVVFTSTEYGCIGVRVNPTVINGHRMYRFNKILEQLNWDPRG